MSVQDWTFAIVGLSFALYIYIAIRSRAASTGEFYVAGGGVPPLANGMATAADWMSAASFISMAGVLSFTGYDGSVYLLGWTGGFVLLALLLAPYLRRFGRFTVPEFIGSRYYSDSARILAVFCALFVSFIYVAGQMRGVGIVFSRFLEIEVTHGVLIGMGAIILNGAIIKKGATIGAGAVIKEGTLVEENTLWAGVPAKQIKQYSQDKYEENKRWAAKYVALSRHHQGNEILD